MWSRFKKLLGRSDKDSNEVVFPQKEEPTIGTKAEIKARNKKNPNNVKSKKYKKPQRKLTKKMQKVLNNPGKKGF